jgi:hypothetical protein
MNDKPEIQSAPPPDLAAAIRKARVESAERGEAIADVREIETGRLALLEGVLKPVIAQAPADADIFDLALAPGGHPRLFVDMIAFVDMAHDRRTYRFHQDTRNGRVLIAESQSVDAIAAAVANYVARRLIERERALAASWPDAQPPQAETKPPQADAGGPRAWPLASGLPRAAPAGDASELASGVPRAPPRRRFVQQVGDAVRLFLMMLGSITLALLIGLGGYLAWTMRLRELWAQWSAGSPF